LRLSGIPVVAQGLDHLDRTTPVVIAVNHTSYLDVVVLLSRLEYRGYAFVAKREFLANPLMRVLLKGFGTQFVERFDVARSAGHANELADMARGGVSLIVFPEGTLKRATGLMPFRTGAFQAAAQAGIPVVPAALRGVRSVLRDGRWYPRRAPVALTLGAPVVPEGTDWAAAVKLRDRVRAEVLRYCGEPDLASGN
ncbi:MAG: lysophospholipid acyltransferase family protein, partial [Betaproteobacteria bacterium]